jgi:bacterioferritin-associated ferredoxin
MDASFARDECGHCPGRVICHCLQVTEDALLQVLGGEEICTLKDLRQRTGAGDGCTACHLELRQILERRFELAMAQPSSSSASPI